MHALRSILLLVLFIAIAGCASKSKEVVLAEAPKGDPWFRAIRLGDLPMLKGLVAGGKDVNASPGKGLTGLMMAARAGNPEVVKWMLQEGADAKKVDEDGQSPLVYALVGLATGPKQVVIVEELLRAGSNPFLIDRLGFQPIQEMMELGMDEQIRKLKFTDKKPCDLVPTPPGDVPLSRRARRMENVPLAEFLEKEGCW